MLNQALHHVVESTIAGRLMGLVEGNGHSAGYRCHILTYHRVENARDNTTGFAAQMAYVAANYDVIAMEDLLNAVRSQSKLPPRALLITFDDAYCNFAEVAWPILRQHRLPVTLFVPTAFPGQPQASFWWDDLTYALRHTTRRDALQTPVGPLPLATARQRRQALKRLKAYVWSLPRQQVRPTVAGLVRSLEVTPPPSPVLDWPALRQLRAQGLTLGAHTRTHPNLARLEPRAAADEIAGSLQDLRREVGDVAAEDVLPILAYPAGFYNRETMRAARRAGIELAFTVRRGANDIRQRDCWLAMRRNNVGPAATLPVLRARLMQAAPPLNHIRKIIEAI